MAHEYSRSEVLTELGIAVATLILLGVAGTALGVVLHSAGQIDSLARILGASGSLYGWLTVIFLGTVAGAAFIVGLNLVSELLELADVTEGLVYNPLAGVFLGMLFGLSLWVTVVAVGVPLGLQFVSGVERPLPFVHLESLAGVMVYSIVIGVGYPVIRWYERDMMVYYESGTSTATRISEEYEPTESDEAVLEVLQDGRESGAPWGRANRQWLINETELDKRTVDESLRDLQDAGWIRRISEDFYEFAKDPRENRTD